MAAKTDKDKEDVKNTTSEPNVAVVIEELNAIITSENIMKTLKSYKTNTKEKEIAFDYVNAYTQFLEEIVSNDERRSLKRTDFEIKDVVSHANMMMKQRYLFVFNSIIVHCPSHYHTIENTLKQKNAEE